MTDHIEAFLEFKQHNQGKSERTVKAYGDALRQLQGFLDGRDLLSAATEDLELFCGPWLHKQGVLAIARRPYIAAVREFFKWATLTKRIRSNPSGQISYPKTGRKLPRVLSLSKRRALDVGARLQHLQRGSRFNDSFC